MRHSRGTKGFDHKVPNDLKDPKDPKDFNRDRPIPQNRPEN